MSSWKTLLHKNAIKIVWGVKSVVLLTKIQALFGEKNLGAFFGAFWLIWGASYSNILVTLGPADTAEQKKTNKMKYYEKLKKIVNF